MCNRVGIGTDCQKVTTHLIEIEHQVQLADIVEEGVCFLYEPPTQPSISTERTKNFDKQVYGLQVRKFVVIRINTHAEKEASIATIYNLVIPELGQTNVVKKTTRTEGSCLPQRNWTGISGRALQLPDALHHADGAVVQDCNPRTWSFKRGRTFSSSSYGTYHFDNRVLPWRF